MQDFVNYSLYVSPITTLKVNSCSTHMWLPNSHILLLCTRNNLETNIFRSKIWGRFLLHCYFHWVMISVLSVSIYLYKLDIEFLKHEVEDEMVLYGCMLKQYRLHCSWTLHISSEHLYNSVHKLAFIPLEICKFCLVEHWSCSENTEYFLFWDIIQFEYF